MLESPNRVIMIFIARLKRSYIAFIIKDSFEGIFHWNINDIKPSDYAIKACIFADYVLDNKVRF